MLEQVVGADDLLISVTTVWESMAAVTRFAGATPDDAVVEPEARAVLKSFDAKVSHHEVAVARLDFAP